MRSLERIAGILFILAGLLSAAPSGAFQLSEVAGMTAGVLGRERVEVTGGPRAQRELATELVFKDGFHLHGREVVTGSPVPTRPGGRRIRLELDAKGRVRYEQWLEDRFAAVLGEAGEAPGVLRVSLDRADLTARVGRGGSSVTVVSRVRLTLHDAATGLTRKAKLKHRASGPLRATVQGVIPTPWGPVDTEYSVEAGVAEVWDDMLYDAAELREYEESLAAVEEGNVLFSFVDPNRTWPGGRVPFVIGDDIFAHRPEEERRRMTARILDAVDHWNDNTSIQLEQVSRFTDEPAFLLFTLSNGCSSFVGLQASQPQRVRTSPSCSRGNMIHEIGHAVGLLHEVQRPDRDQFVFVNEGSIREPSDGQPDPARNFDKVEGDFLFSRTYDFGSVMHYGPDFFARDDLGVFDPLPIVAKLPLPPGVQMGQRDGLSQGDLQAVAALYGDRPVSSCAQGSCSEAWLEGFDFDPDLEDFRSVVRRTGDFDGDGREDLVSFAREAIPGARGRVRVALAADSPFFRGTDHFADAGVWHEDFCSFEQDVCEVGDFDGDGLSDIAWIVPTTGEVLVSLNEGGRFGAARSWHHRIASQGDRFAVGDFDGRGGDDLVAFADTEEGQVFLAVSAGSSFADPLFLAEALVEGSCGRFRECHAADYDGDGDDDLVGFGSDGRLTLLEAFRELENPPVFDGGLGGAPSVGGAFPAQIVESVPGPATFAAQALGRTTRGLVPTLELFPTTPAFRPPVRVVANVCPFDAVCAPADLDGSGEENQFVTFLADPLGPIGVANRTLRLSDLAISSSELSNTLFCGRGDGCLLADVDGDGRDEVIDVVDQTSTLPFPRPRGTVFVSGSGGGFQGPGGGGVILEVAR